MKKPLEDVTDKERQNAKAVNFGLLFAMGVPGLKKYAMDTYGVEMDLDKAQFFRERFFNAYYGFSNWQCNQKFETETRTIGGRRRVWYNETSELPELCNSPIQGTAADILKRALVNLDADLMGTDSRIIATVHDEIIVEAPKKIISEAKQVIEGAMIKAGEYYLSNVPVMVDIAESHSWGGC